MSTSSHAPARITWHTHYALSVLALIYVFNYIDRLVISILIEPIKAEFGVSDTEIGLLSGLAFALFYTVFGFPLGRLSDRIGRKPVIALACVAWSGMTMLCGIATSFMMLLLFRIGVAIGEAGGTPPSVAMVSELYPPEQRSRALSIFLMGPSLGAVLGLGLGGWMAQTYGWRTAFLVIGAPGVFIGLLLWLTVRAPARPAPVAGSTASTSDERWTQTVASLFATPSFLLIVIAGSLAAAMGYAVGTWAPSFLIRSHGLDMKNAGILLGLGGGFVATVGTLTCGVVTDRLVARDKGWQLGVPLLACLLSIPLGLAFFLWPAHTFQLGSMTVPQAYLFYLGFAFCGTWWSVPCFGAITHLFPPSRMAQANAIFVMGMGLIGVGVGPLIVGTLSDVFAPSKGVEALRYALACTVMLYLITSLSLLRAIPAYRRYLQELAARA